MDIKKCTICNKKIDKDNYKTDRKICRDSYNNNTKERKIITRSLEKIIIKRKETLLTLSIIQTLPKRKQKLKAL